MSTGEVAEDGPPDEHEIPTVERRKAADRVWLITNLLLIIGLAAFVLVVPAIALRLHHSAREEVTRRTDIVYPQFDRSDEAGPSKTTFRRGHVTEGQATFDTAFSDLNSELQRTSLQLTFDTAQKAIKHLSEAEHAWDDLAAQTKSDSVGRRIATDKRLLIRFIALEELRKQHGPEHTGVTAQDGFDQLYALSPKQVSEFESLSAVAAALGRQAFDAAVFHRACHSSLLQLREHASDLPTGAHTLSAQLRIEKETFSIESDELAEAAAIKLQRELTNELYALKKDLADAETYVTALNRDLAKIHRGESSGSATDSRSLSVASRDDYVKEMPAIRSLLKPLTTPGYSQPVSADLMTHESTKRPISYSALKRIGALEKKDGISVLFRVAGAKSTSHQNDRPLGDFPRMYSLGLLDKPEVRTRVEKAQRLLLQYGPFLIEDGLLEP